MIRRIVAALGIAFGASALLYKPMHLPQVPEIARYVSGGALFTAVAYTLYGDGGTISFERIAVCWIITGIGVAVNRLRMSIFCEE